MQLQLMCLHSRYAPVTLQPMSSTSAAERPQALRPPVVDEWRDILDRHAKVSCALEKALQVGHEIGVSEFEILDRLVDADSGKYRMSELTGDIYLSQSALSRAVDRLEKDGLVERIMCDNDRRGVFVKLTDVGRKLHREALPTHREVLGSCLGQ